MSVKFQTGLNTLSDSKYIFEIDDTDSAPGGVLSVLLREGDGVEFDTGDNNITDLILDTQVTLNVAVSNGVLAQLGTSSNEKRYVISCTKDGVPYWKGYILPDLYEEYSKEINIPATIRAVDFAIFDTVKYDPDSIVSVNGSENKTVLNTFVAAFNELGFNTLPLIVASSWRPEWSVPDANNPLAHIEYVPSKYRKEDGTYESWMHVLGELCDTFQLRMTWAGGAYHLIQMDEVASKETFTAWEYSIGTGPTLIQVHPNYDLRTTIDQPVNYGPFKADRPNGSATSSFSFFLPGGDTITDPNLEQFSEQNTRLFYWNEDGPLGYQVRNIASEYKTVLLADLFEYDEEAEPINRTPPVPALYQESFISGKVGMGLNVEMKIAAVPNTLLPEGVSMRMSIDGNVQRYFKIVGTQIEQDVVTGNNQLINVLAVSGNPDIPVLPAGSVFSTARAFVTLTRPWYYGETQIQGNVQWRSDHRQNQAPDEEAPVAIGAGQPLFYGIWTTVDESTTIPYNFMHPDDEVKHIIIPVALHTSNGTPLRGIRKTTFNNPQYGIFQIIVPGGDPIVYNIPDHPVYEFVLDYFGMRLNLGDNSEVTQRTQAVTGSTSGTLTLPSRRLGDGAVSGVREALRVRSEDSLGVSNLTYGWHRTGQTSGGESIDDLLAESWARIAKAPATRFQATIYTNGEPLHTGQILVIPGMGRFLPVRVRALPIGDQYDVTAVRLSYASGDITYSYPDGQSGSGPSGGTGQFGHVFALGAAIHGLLGVGSISRSRQFIPKSSTNPVTSLSIDRPEVAYNTGDVLFITDTVNVKSYRLVLTQDLLRDSETIHFEPVYFDNNLHTGSPIFESAGTYPNFLLTVDGLRTYFERSELTRLSSGVGGVVTSLPVEPVVFPINQGEELIVQDATSLDFVTVVASANVNEGATTVPVQNVVLNAATGAGVNLKDSLWSTIAQNAREIELRVSQGDLESAISLLMDEIQLRVSNEELETYIRLSIEDGIEIEAPIFKTTNYDGTWTPEGGYVSSGSSGTAIYKDGTLVTSNGIIRNSLIVGSTIIGGDGQGIYVLKQGDTMSGDLAFTNGTSIVGVSGNSLTPYGTGGRMIISASPGVTISGSTILSGSLTNRGNVSVSGSLTLSGSATVRSALNVSGSATLADALNVDGTVSLASRLSVGENATIAGTLVASGNTGLGGSATSNRLHVYGNSVFSGSLGSPSFASGWTGNGWRMNQNASSKWHLETDNLTVRGTMSIYELLIRQINVTNGSLLVSSSGKVVSVTPILVDVFSLGFDSELGHGFAVNDLIRARRFRQDNTTIYDSKCRVTSVPSTTAITVQLEEGNAPTVGMDFARIGNTTNPDRQGLVYLTSDDSSAPFIDIVDGVNSHAAFNTPATHRVRLGRLDGLSLPALKSLDGYGLYAGRGYFVADLNNFMTFDESGLEIKATNATLSGSNVSIDAGTFRATATGFSVDSTLFSGSIRLGAATHTVGSGVYMDGMGRFRAGSSTSGDNFILYSGSVLQIKTPNFSVDPSGNVSMSGSVSASAGRVGGWQLASGSLFSTSGGNQMLMSSSERALELKRDFGTGYVDTVRLSADNTFSGFGTDIGGITAGSIVAELGASSIGSGNSAGNMIPNSPPTLGDFSYDLRFNVLYSSSERSNPYSSWDYRVWLFNGVTWVNYYSSIEGDGAVEYRPDMKRTYYLDSAPYNDRLFTLSIPSGFTNFYIQPILVVSTFSPLEYSQISFSSNIRRVATKTQINHSGLLIGESENTFAEVSRSKIEFSNRKVKITNAPLDLSDGATVTLASSGRLTRFSGNMNVTGAFSVNGTKSFRINHPDPAKAYRYELWHSSCEAPTAGENHYSYVAVASEPGETITVEIEDYFKYLNENPRIFIQAKGQFANAYGSLNEAQTALLITCEKAGEYDILLIGTRKDKAARESWRGAERVTS